MKFLLKGFIFRIIFVASGFLVSLLIAKLAGADRFGIISLMIVNAGFIQIVSGLGTDAAIVWHGISGKPGDSNKIFSFTIYATLLQLLLFGIAAFLFFKYNGTTILSREKGINIFYAELLYFSGLIVTEKYAALFYSQQMAALCNKILALISSGLVFTLFVVLFNAPSLVVDNPVWVISIFVFIPAMVLLFFYHGKFSPVLIKISRDTVNSFVSFSLIVLVTNLIQFIAFRVDFWFIDYFHGKGDVGIYAQASKFSQMLWIIPGVFAGLIIPALKNAKDKLSVAELVSICRLLFFAHIFFAVLVVAGAFLLYQFFLPEEFFNGFSALLLMMPGYIFFIITIVLAAFFSANRLLKINLLGSSLCCVLMIILDVLLIPRFSYTGAAIANLVAYTVTTIFFVAAFRKQTGLLMQDHFKLRKYDLKILLMKFSERENGKID